MMEEEFSDQTSSTAYSQGYMTTYFPTQYAWNGIQNVTFYSSLSSTNNMNNNQSQDTIPMETENYPENVQTNNSYHVGQNFFSNFNYQSDESVTLQKMETLTLNGSYNDPIYI